MRCLTGQNERSVEKYAAFLSEVTGNFSLNAYYSPIIKTFSKRRFLLNVNCRFIFENFKISNL